MSLDAVMVVAAALFAIGVYGVLSQQTFVMIMMGLELMIAGGLLATVAMWSMVAGGTSKGQLLGIVALTVMAVEAAIGFALIIGIYRIRKADMTEKLRRLKG
jgi:NAD(P)H-quinone oxidoreductase subunit 4L